MGRKVILTPESSKNEIKFKVILQVSSGRDNTRIRSRSLSLKGGAGEYICSTGSGRYEYLNRSKERHGCN